MKVRFDITKEDISFIPTYSTTVNSRDDIVINKKLKILNSPNPIFKNSDYLLEVKEYNEKEEKLFELYYVPDRFSIKDIYERWHYFGSLNLKSHKLFTISYKELVYLVSKDRRFLYENLLENNEVNFLLIDTAKVIPDLVKCLKEKVDKKFYSKIIIGNIATGEEFVFIQNELPNIKIRVGIGVGSVCLTSKKTGIKITMLSSLLDIYKEYYSSYLYKGEGLNLRDILIADGGIKESDDFLYYYIFTDWVMSGYYLAKTHSITNKTRYYSGLSSYEMKQKKRYIEGMTLSLPFVYWSLEDRLNEVEDGFRSLLSYLDIEKVSDFNYLYLVRNGLLFIKEQCKKFK